MGWTKIAMGKVITIKMAMITISKTIVMMKMKPSHQVPMKSWTIKWMKIAMEDWIGPTPMIEPGRLWMIFRMGPGAHAM